MKSSLLLFLLTTQFTGYVYAQNSTANNPHRQALYSLIETYSLAREKNDTTLLKNILTTDVDQLVSSGEWRNGIQSSIGGMLRSSGSKPGERTLTVDKLRFITTSVAVVDARYEIKNTDGTVRKMWSTFVVVYDQDTWKIAAIRNMLPAGRP